MAMAYLPQFFCYKHKSYVPGGFESFKEHISRKDHCAPFICGQDGCLSEFLSRPSLYRHIRDHHLLGATNFPVLPVPVVATNDPQGGSSLTGNDAAGFAPASVRSEGSFEEDFFEQLPAFDFEPEEDPDEEPAPVDLRSSAEKSVLRLRGITYMTGSALNTVQEQCFSMMQDAASHLKVKVTDFLSQPNQDAFQVESLLREFSLCDPFSRIKTKPQQMKCFKEKYGLLEANEIFLDNRFDSRQHSSRPILQPSQVANSFQSMSIITILKHVMSNDNLRTIILSERSSNDGYLRNFRDGSLFATLPAELKEAIRIILYLDDLEPLQALSARQGVYKISGVYIGIQNLPADLNALLCNIWVTILSFASDCLKAKVWEGFLRDMTILENEGVTIEVNGMPFTFHAVLVAQIGDDLAAHQIIGLKSPAAKLFCRCCYITRDELWADGFELGEPRTSEKHAKDVASAKISEAWQKATGVLGSSPLEGLRFFRPIEHSVFDIFHDLPQGICKMEVKLALRHYVCEKKYFDEATLNARVQFFDYGFAEKNNKPSPTFTASYLSDISSYNLHQTGCQMWLLTRAFPFLFADLVPQDDMFMQLISLLNQIMSISFAHAHCEADLGNLGALVFEHHRVFKVIFPGKEETAGEPASEEVGTASEEQVDDPEGTPATEADEEDDSHFEIFQDHHQEVDLEVVPSRVNEGANAEEVARKKQKKRKKKRIIRFINKHHHLLHYAAQLRKFGPMILYWCARYEAKHYFFKLVATVCHNYINFLKTLMEMLQMKTASDMLNQQKQILVVSKQGRKLYTVCDTVHAKQLIDSGVNALSKVYVVKFVKCHGIDYRPELFVTLSLKNGGHYPVFGKIIAVYVSFSEDAIYLISQNWKTVKFDPKFAAYEVNPDSDAPLQVVQPAQMATHRLLSLWKRYDSNQMYLAPQTIA